MNFSTNYLSESKYSLKAPYEMIPKYITIHNTGNEASAKNEITYMISNSNSNSTGFHIAVDDVEAIIGIPFDRNAWHCGDGNGKGNRESIGVEICYSTGDETKFRKAEQNAIEVVRWLMDKYNIPIENVVAHRYWSGKNCPHKTDIDWFVKQLVLVEPQYEINQVKVDLFGEIRMVDSINVNDFNHVKLRDLECSNINISWDGKNVLINNKVFDTTESILHEDMNYIKIRSLQEEGIVGEITWDGSIQTIIVR